MVRNDRRSAITGMTKRASKTWSYNQDDAANTPMVQLPNSVNTVRRCVCTQTVQGDWRCSKENTGNSNPTSST